MHMYTNVRATVRLDLDKENIFKRILSRKEGRLDDRVETLTKRIESYHLETIPMLEEINEFSPIVKVNGNKDVLDVHFELMNSLKYFL